MDRFEQFPTLMLMGDQQVAACVDYQVCGHCGFRLMRVETTLINDQRLIVKHCPICDLFTHHHPNSAIETLSVEDRLQYFDTWLATHGLDREVLVRHYHLAIEDFFDSV